MEELEPKQRSKFVQLITDLLSKLKQKFSKSKEMLGEITRLENMFIETAKSVETKTVDNKTETQYSMYDEHASNIMQWEEYSASTKTGDCKIFSVRGGFALIEATEDGYIELARGEYKYVKDLRDTYEEPTHSVYVHTQMYENDKTGYSENNSTFENKIEYGQSSAETQSEGFQTNTARDNEYLR